MAKAISMLDGSSVREDLLISGKLSIFFGRCVLD